MHILNLMQEKGPGIQNAPYKSNKKTKQITTNCIMLKRKFSYRHISDSIYANTLQIVIAMIALYWSNDTGRPICGFCLLHIEEMTPVALTKY